MKNLISTAAVAAILALVIPATAQTSAPGTSVQTGTAASNGKNSGAGTDAAPMNDPMMNDSSMHHSMKKKPMKHASTMSSHSMATSDTKAVTTTGPYGTSMNGGSMGSTHSDMSPGMVGKAGGQAGGTKTGN